MDTMTTERVTITEEWNGQRITWTARHNGKVIATIRQDPVAGYGMWDSEPLALAIGAHFGVSREQILTVPNERRVRFVRENSDGARIVPHVAEVDAERPTGYYVAVRSGHQLGPLLGSYPDHGRALGNQARVTAYVRAHYTAQGMGRWTFGVGALVLNPGEDLPPGLLNEVLGLDAPAVEEVPA